MQFTVFKTANNFNKNKKARQGAWQLIYEIFYLHIYITKRNSNDTYFPLGELKEN